MNKPFIVAEMSANHLGKLGRAIAIVDAAAAAGADAVKLQTWDRMVIDENFVIEDGPWAGLRLEELYKEAKTPWAWHQALFARCRTHGMIGFSTPFDRASLEFLELLHCPMYKVASFEITDLPLIRAIAQTGKPIIISTGMATRDEIADAAAEVYAEHDRLTLLKCTSAYPADASEANLNTMIAIGARSGCDIGLSDHTPGIGVAVAAATLGATVIEKHLTLARTDGGPDAAFSLEPAEFASLVTECRRAAQAMGSVTYGPTPQEMPQHALRRSLYIAKDMRAGDLLTTQTVRTARPAKGLPPKCLPQVLGRPVTRDVSRETPMTWDLIQ